MVEKVRVVHIIPTLSIGGAERALYNVLSGGLARRFDSHVISLRDEGTYGQQIRELGVPVHTLGMVRSGPGGRGLYRLRTLMRELRPSLLQGWMYHGNLAVALASKFSPGHPAVVWNVRHSLYDITDEKFITQLIIRGNRYLARRPDAILYNSRLSQRQHESFGFCPERGKVIPNGFDTELLKPSVSERGLVRKRLGIPEGVALIGHVGRFHPMKDHAGFLRASVAVAKAHEDVQFLLVGRNVSLDNPALSDIVPAELAHRFRCLGERLDVHQLMRAMDIVCQSSWSEAFPNILGEAMASGVPCVATDVGDSSEIVGKAGRVVPPSNPDALGAAMLELLAMPPAELVQLGMQARARIESRYALKAIVLRYCTLYEQMLGENA